MNHLERTRLAADALSNKLTDLLDLAGVPDGSPAEIKACKAMSYIYEVLEQVPRFGRTASFIFSESPLVYVSPNMDMRNWRTQEGREAWRGSQSGGRRATVLAKARSVLARGAVVDRRVITSEAYQMALDEASIESQPVVIESLGSSSLADFKVV